MDENPYQSPAEADATGLEKLRRRISFGFRIVALILGVVTLIGFCSGLYELAAEYREERAHLLSQTILLGAFTSGLSAVMLLFVAKRI